MTTALKIADRIQTTAVSLARPSMGLDGRGIVYLAGDTNDDAVHACAFDLAGRKRLWSLELDKASNRLDVEPRCSRCYLPRVAALPGGGALVSWKRGVKEVVKKPSDFDNSDWGLMIARLDAAGTIVWKKPYKIHKGNGQVILDPYAPAVCQLIATDGIRWEISTETGAVLRTLPRIFPDKSSGEKIYSWVAPRKSKPAVIHAITSGWSGCDSLYWNSLINRAVPWAASRAYPDMGGDLTYVCGASPSGRPGSAFILAPYGGFLQVNEWRPRGMRYPPGMLLNRGPMNAQDRFGPPCCADPTERNSVLAIVTPYLVRLKDGEMLDTLEPGGWMTLCHGRDGEVLVGQTNGASMSVYRVAAE